MKVNGHEIPQKAVEYELNRLIHFYAQHGIPQDQLRAQLPQLKARAEEQAIGTALLFTEADRLEIMVSEDEIDDAVKAMEEQAGSHEKLLEILAKQNQNIVGLRNEIKRGKKVDKLVQKITSEAGEPSEKEVESYFEAHRAEFGKAEQVLAQHILISPKSQSAEDDLEALSRIQKIRSRIEQGSDFATEAATHSDCPSGKQSGGSLGWFSRGMMVKEFDEAAFSLPVGGLSDIIKTQFGYHIIYKNDAQEESVPEFTEVADQVRDLLRHSRRGEVLNQYVTDLRAKATIEK